MNKQCGIARDLMPLVIDKAASEGSSEYVFKHIEGCAECRAQFKILCKELESPVASENDAAFAHSVWQLKHKQRQKRLLVSVLCLFLTACLAFTGIEVYNGLLIDNFAVKPAEELEFSLFTLPSGEMQILAKSKDSEDGFFFLTGCSVYEEDGTTTMYVWALGPRFDFLPPNQPVTSADLFGYQSNSKLCFIDDGLYWTDLGYTVKTVHASDGSRGLEYIVRWEAPDAIDVIRYGQPHTQQDSPILYRTGDEIEKISASEYLLYLDEHFGGEQDLPHDFYGNNTYIFSLAKAWIRGEELPEIPREYLPSIQDFPDMEGAEESASLYVYIPHESPLSIPLVIKY